MIVTALQFPLEGIFSSVEISDPIEVLLPFNDIYHISCCSIKEVMDLYCNNIAPLIQNEIFETELMTQAKHIINIGRLQSCSE